MEALSHARGAPFAGGGVTMSRRRPLLRRRERARRSAEEVGAALRDGRPEALPEVHGLYGAAVLGYLRGVFRDDPATAEDVHQEVFLDVWRRAASFDPDRAALGTWVMMIARSRAIDHLRRRIPEPVDPSGPRLDEAREREDGEASPDALIERWRLAALLAELPEVEATVLRLRFHEGLSQSEIAARTGIPLGTVKTHMVRGLGRLRDRMEEDA
jgi:RNA polymerase sigma-70 factor (ECF subfamily)